ncbi:MAG: hypothetical protein KIT35_09335 [Piscinibacter sp.]|uniref:hypothetical protein n=1 Tax=Piscinibacter sp. TaxID=1903157 RepID=UPI0025848E34|nr:hypothetical protein [Piscinibacter sp.]MCW5664024.1 hypothetical protein [Piscinibacter sp.]
MAARAPKKHRAAGAATVVRRATAKEIEQAAGTVSAFIPQPGADATPAGEARIAGWLVSALVPAMPPRDEPRFSVLDVAVGRYSKVEVDLMRAMAPFDVPVLLREVPSELRSLNADEPVRERRAGVDGLTTAGALRAELEAVAERQAKGRYTLGECAALLAEAAVAAGLGAEGGTLERYWRQLSEAAASGSLAVLDPLTLLRSSVDEWPGPSSGQLLVYRGELVDWLKRENHALRLPDEQSKDALKTASGGPAAGSCAPSAPDAVPKRRPYLSMQWRLQRIREVRAALEGVDAADARASRVGVPSTRAAVLTKLRADDGKPAWTDTAFKHAWERYLKAKP